MKNFFIIFFLYILKKGDIKFEIKIKEFDPANLYLENFERKRLQTNRQIDLSTNGFVFTGLLLLSSSSSSSSIFRGDIVDDNEKSKLEEDEVHKQIDLKLKYYDPHRKRLSLTGILPSKFFSFSIIYFNSQLFRKKGGKKENE